MTTPAQQAYMKAYWAKPENKERNRLLNLERRRADRRAVIAFLGGRCLHCGFDDPRALQVDHVDDDGYIERKHDGQNFYRKMTKRILAGAPGYQLLCANCNWIKRAIREGNWS